MFHPCRILLMAFLMALFLPAPIDAQNEREFNFDFDRSIGRDECFLPGFPLITRAKIYFAGSGSGVHSRGKKTGLQIDDSWHEANLFEVTVNSPTEPVILLLGSYEPGIWHISWTKGSQIEAVVVSGYHNQKLSGLPENVPVINSSNDNRGPCGYFYESGSGIPMRLFGREVDGAFDIADGRVVIGEALPAGAELISQKEFRLEDHRDPKWPLIGQAGLDESVAKGLIRKAAQEDIQEYFAAVAKASGLPEYLITEEMRAESYSNFKKYYVVLSPDFIIPGNAPQNTYFLPDGLPQPKGPAYGVNSFRNASADSQRYREKAKEAMSEISASVLDLPPDFKVHAAHVSGGAKLDIQIDQSGRKARLKQVTVNSPDDPAVLLLETYEPTIWHFNWTKESKISAVAIVSFQEQRVSGLPEGVPLIIYDRNKSRHQNNYYFNVSYKLSRA